MERKLVKQGRNALTITLPVQWLRAKNLIAGDAIHIYEQNRSLLITASGSTKKKAITVDLTDSQQSMMYHNVLAKYIEGYDTITILHNNSKAAQELAPYLIGMVAEEQTPTKVVLKSVIQVPEDNFNALMRRAGHILNQQANTLVAIAQGKGTIDDIKQQEKLLDQNLLYCLRYLTKYENQQHSYREFLLCTTLELAGDQLSRIARHITKKVTLAETIRKGIADYVTNLFRNDFKQLYHSLRLFRNNIKQQTFADGLANSLAEILYNYIGYVVGEKPTQANLLGE